MKSQIVEAKGTACIPPRVPLGPTIGLPSTPPSCPVGPWQTAHLAAKIGAPCLAVPFPGGSSAPVTGLMEKSSFAIPSGVAGRPKSSGLGFCAEAVVQAARATATTRRLDNRIVDPPVGLDLPRLNGVRVTNLVRLQVGSVNAPELSYFRKRRLNLAALVGRAGQQHRFLSVPPPR